MVQTQTHDLTFTDSEVRKRFVSWDRGEAEREWACLRLLAEHAPGVAPRPLRRETVDGAPVVVMERLPGVPLGGAPLTSAQTASLGEVLGRLYDVPLAAIRAAGIEERSYGISTHAATVVEWLGDTYDLEACQDAVLVREGIDRALAWLPMPDALPRPDVRVLGIADLNPANVLWDGDGAGSWTSRTAVSATRRTSSRTTSSTSGPADRGVRRRGPGRRRRPGRDGAHPDDGLPPAVGGLLARHAAARQRRLAAQPAGQHRGAGAPPAGVAGRLTRQGVSRAFAQFASSLVAVSGLSTTPWVVHWATAWT